MASAIEVLATGRFPLFAVAFFLEGLTVVTLIGTGILIATFAFLYYAEQNTNKK